MLLDSCFLLLRALAKHSPNPEWRLLRGYASRNDALIQHHFRGRLDSLRQNITERDG